MVLRRNQRTRPPARSVPPSCLTLPACLSVCVSIHTSVYLSLEWISALPLRDCLHHHLSYAHYVYLFLVFLPSTGGERSEGCHSPRRCCRCGCRPWDWLSWRPCQRGEAGRAAHSARVLCEAAGASQQHAGARRIIRRTMQSNPIRSHTRACKLLTHAGRQHLT